MDASLITQMAGAAPQRMQWAFSGDNMCTYFIKNGC
jgi:predicted ArsR family transcriptional regulator